MKHALKLISSLSAGLCLISNVCFANIFDINACNCKPGAQGPTGPAGPTGPTGSSVTGPTGPTGPQGTPGVANVLVNECVFFITQGRIQIPTVGTISGVGPGYSYEAFPDHVDLSLAPGLFWSIVTTADTAGGDGTATATGIGPLFGPTFTLLFDGPALFINFTATACLTA